MRKSCYILLFSSVFLSIMIISNTVSATSWGEVKPQEVVDSAEVIITGKYDFTSKPKPSKFIFQGLNFNIKNVYRGDVSEQIITAGIDYYDVDGQRNFRTKMENFFYY